jgi:hypothetical protein
LTELDEDFGTLLELDFTTELLLFAVLEELTIFEELLDNFAELDEDCRTLLELLLIAVLSNIAL